MNMAIMFEPKGITTESNPKYENHTRDGLLPLGQKPEGNELDKALLKLENVIHSLN